MSVAEITSFMRDEVTYAVKAPVPIAYFMRLVMTTLVWALFQSIQL